MTNTGRYNGSFDRTAGSHDLRASDLTIKDYANGMPNMRPGEIFGAFLRQLKWLIPLLLIGTLASFFFTKDLKRQYVGEGRILVQLGSEYVYQSVTSTQNSGLTLTPDHIVLNEIGLMKNSDLIERVTGELRDEFGERRFAKSHYKKINAAAGDPIAKKNAIVDLHKFMDKSLVVVPKPKSSVVDMLFKHEDPEIAVRGVDLFIKAYQDARKDVFIEGSSDAISERREATENQLKQNEREIQKFLAKNNISDFASEQTGARTRTEKLRADLNLLRAQMSETEAALNTVEGQLRNTPEKIDLFVDDRASQRVAQAELELKQLLAKYLPNSNPVRRKQEEIRQLSEILSGNGGRAAGGRRVGPNTVYTALLTRRNTLQSSADSFREKEFILQRQLDAADSKVRRLMVLSPTFNGLLREQGTLDTRLKGYTTKEQEAIINQQQAQSDSENVRIISISTLPRKGRNIRMIMFAVCTVIWAFTLFMIALMKVFLDPSLYAPVPPTRRSHTRHDDAYGPKGSDQKSDPHPPAYSPAVVPEPVPMPAAAQLGEYADEAVGGYTSYPAAYSEPAAHNHFEPQPYVPQPVAYAAPASAETPASFPLGNTALAYDPAYAQGNPYLQGRVSAAMPYAAAGEVPASEDG